ncbi:hypothetical protein [Paenibacillus sp. VT-400]|uniref:hypothetical protein n=1 Tax=Paenibacillus sp. VT-400 TaxID=1495853 RepID=UPI001F2CECDC|nr:hypothetical protein [Paenibacillus sp. VT-400]
MNDNLTHIFAMQNALDHRIIQERGIEKTTDEWVVGITLAMESETRSAAKLTGSGGRIRSRSIRTR